MVVRCLTAAVYKKRFQPIDMQLKKKILIGVAFIMIVIQFFQPAKNHSAEVTNAHIEQIYAIPENVKAVLAQSCYDCHSNNTRYPWYSNIQPMGWVLATHIKNGKAALNFSDFGNYSKRKQKNKLTSIISQTKDNTMPLYSYMLLHRDAVLYKKDKQAVIAWASILADSLSR